MSPLSEQHAVFERKSRSAAESWAEWDEFVTGVPNTGFMQTSWWADFRVTTGFEHFGAVIRHQGSVIGGGIVHKLARDEDTCFYYIPEGPVLPADESAAETVLASLLHGIDARRAYEAETVSHLRIEPRWERMPVFMREFRPVPEFMDSYTEPRNTLCIDLRPSEDEILARMKPKGRYNIRVARKHGVSIVEDNLSLGVDDFLAIYGAMTDRQGLAAKPDEYFRDLISILSNRGAGSLFFAERNGERIAAAVVVYCGARATYFFGGSMHQHRHVMAPYLLHFEIMRRARAVGCVWYDLWGVAPPDATGHPWQDISTFKRKFGGCEVALVPTLDYVFDGAAYERYLADEADAGRSAADSAPTR